MAKVDKTRKNDIWTVITTLVVIGGAGTVILAVIGASVDTVLAFTIGFAISILIVFLMCKDGIEKT